MQDFFSTIDSPVMPSSESTSSEVFENESVQTTSTQSESEVKAIKSTDGELKTIFSRRTAKLMGVQVAGIGSYVPDNIVTNEQLQEERGFDPEWIVKRTGIRERRFVIDGQATSDLCIPAAQRAMESAGVTADEIDLLVVGTFTPDYHCPSTACLVQDRLGLDAPAFDVAAACSGYIYAMVTAAQYVVTGNAKKALVIGADCNSRIVDPQNPKIAPLFGDGAGAVVLTPGSQDQGFVSYQMGSDGSGGPMLDRPCGGSKSPSTADSLSEGQQFLQMDGRKVFNWAVRAVGETIELVLESADLKPNDVGLYLLHQANIRIIDAACKKLKVDKSKVFNNLQKYGNTSAASIPLAMNEAYDQGRIESGDTILMSGFGAGLTWGTALFRW